MRYPRSGRSFFFIRFLAILVPAFLHPTILSQGVDVRSVRSKPAITTSAASAVGPRLTGARRRANPPAAGRAKRPLTGGAPRGRSNGGSAGPFVLVPLKPPGPEAVPVTPGPAVAPAVETAALPAAESTAPTASSGPGSNGANGGSSGENGANGNGSLPPLVIDVGPDGIRLFAVKVDAAQVFVELGIKAATKIVVDDTVNRQITTQISAKTVAEIIDRIAGAYGLSSAQVDGAFLISEGIPKSPSTYLLTDIDAITTKYVLAPNAKSLLPTFLQDHVKINPEQNAVILSAPREVLQKFREDIAQFDVPAAQIMLETLMVEFSESTGSEISTLLGYSNASDAVAIDPTTGLTTYQSVARLPTDFSARLRALTQKGTARIRAKPQIATVSGQQAEIFIGRQRFLSTPVEVRRQGDFQGEQLNYIDAGIRLEITPYTGGKGEIIAEIEPEISVFSAINPITGLPDKTTRRAQTVLRVGDGETIIIGGLTQSEERFDRKRVPLLSELPIIGGLFRSTVKTLTNTELVIFVTPTVLSGTGHLPNGETERQLFDRFQIQPPPVGAPASGAAPSGAMPSATMPPVSIPSGDVLPPSPSTGEKPSPPSPPVPPARGE